jgi:hypothetical protein
MKDMRLCICELFTRNISTKPRTCTKVEWAWMLLINHQVRALEDSMLFYLLLALHLFFVSHESRIQLQTHGSRTLVLAPCCTDSPLQFGDWTREEFEPLSLLAAINSPPQSSDTWRAPNSIPSCLCIAACRWVNNLRDGCSGRTRCPFLAFSAH